MKDLQRRIQRMLTEKNRQSRTMALAAALSMILMFLVPYAGILPGAAITNSDLNNGVPFVENEALTSVPPGAADLTGRITGITFTAGGETYTGTNGSSVTIQGGAADPLALTIAMVYEFTDRASLSEVLSSGFSYYQMTSDIKPNNGYYGSSMIVTDAEWNPTKAAGYYSISEEGLIVIHYTDDYLAYLTNSNGMRGTLNFKGSAARNRNEYGDKEFLFGTTEVTIVFDDTKPVISKKGTPQLDGTNRYIDWQITIQNPYGYVDMSQYTLTDTLNGDALDWSTISPTISPDGVTASCNSDGTITFTNPANPPEYITISYRQYGAVNGGEYNNQASLTNGSTTIPCSALVSIENALSISKQGTPDYEIAEGMEGKVQWTIAVSHKSGDSLKNVAVNEQNAVFNADFAGLVVTDQLTGAVIDSSRYTVSADGRTLTFADDSSLPSAVYITFTAQAGDYDANIGAQQSQTLYNKVTASRSDIAEPASVKGQAVYRHEMNFTKTLNGPNQELGTLEWQFTLKSNELNGNGDSSSKESINGYTISDAVFVGMTQEEVAEKIGFNVYHYADQTPSLLGNQHSSGEQKITLLKSSPDSDTITISFNPAAYPDTVINMIKLYYSMSIRENLSPADWAKYNNGETVRISNTATASDRSGHQTMQGTAGENIHLRVEADKSYGGANDPNDYSFGSEDTTDRVLYWDVDFVKDAGFSSTDTYSDQLTAGNPAVGHCILPSQRAGFTLTGSASSGETKQTVPSNLYTITFVDANGSEVGADENATGFVITFTSDIDALSSNPYRYLKLHYESTAMTSDIPNGSAVTFANSYDFGGQHKTTNGMTYTRDNPAVIKPLTITVKKTWNDAKNTFGDRPAAITVRVLRTEADAGGNLPASPVWGVVGEYTIPASTSESNDSYMIPDDFDQWKYDAVTGTVTQYYYKIQEVLGDGSGYTLTYIDDPKKIEISKSERVYTDMALTNKSDHAVAKYALDADGSHVTSVNVEPQNLTINGTQGLYYLFRWEIVNIPGSESSQTEFVDTIAAGSVFVDNSVSDAAYKPKFLYNWGSTGDMTENPQSWEWGYRKNSETSVSFFKPENSDAKIIYYTAVPADDLDSVLSEGKISNSVTYDGSTASVAVDVSTSIPADDTDHLTKAFVKGFAGGYLNYTIDVNPTGKKLSNTGTIDITDILSYIGGQKSQYDGAPVSLDDLDITLNSIKVYPLVNGEPDTAHPLNGNEFSYTVDYNVSNTDDLTFSAAKEGTYNSSAVQYWDVSGWSPGDEVTVTVPKNPAYNNAYDNKLNLYIYSSERTGSDLSSPSPSDTKYFSNFDSSGNATVTFTVPENAKEIVVASGYGDSVTYETVTDYSVADGGVSVTGSGVTVSASQTETISNNRNVKYWEITGYEAGQTITVSLTRNPVFDFLTSSNGIMVWCLGFTGGTPSRDYTTWTQDNRIGGIEYNFSTSREWTFEIPDNTTYIVVVSEETERQKDIHSNVISSLGGLTGTATTPTAPAVLNITVPDQQAMRIEYSYIVEGWDEGNILKFANTASFYADNGEGSDSTSGDEMCTESSATAETLRYPTIFKTDVGNYAINDLKANFLVAKYVAGSGWVFADSITTVIGTNTSYRELHFPESPYTGCLETAGAATFPNMTLDGQRPAVLAFADTDMGNHENLHNFNLETGVLYKFVELNAPDAYRQPVWSLGYAGNQEFVFYYNYSGYDGTIPDDAAGRVRPILKNSAVNIPNSQNITLTAAKSFSGASAQLPDQSTVQLGLYWSTSKKGTNLKLVSSEDLELPAGFAAVQTVNYTGNGTENSVSWSGMPSGYSGAPIYYFVREISYSYGGAVYTYDEATGKYLNGTTEGKYQPVYTRNGTNTDGTVIEVNNSEGIIVRKLWVNASGESVTPPNEAGASGKMAVGFIVYGVKADGTKIRLLLDTETLTYENNYEYILPASGISGSDGGTYALTDFSNFEIKENLTSEQSAALYGRFLSPQTTRKISNGTGTLEIINTDASSPTTNAVVQKIWKDGNKDHDGDSLTVELLQSTNAGLTSAQLESYANGEAIPGVYAKGSMRSIENVRLIRNGSSDTVTFDAEITAVTGSTAAISASYENAVLTVTGNAAGSTELEVTLANGQTKTITVTSVDCEITLGDQGDGTAVWTYTWENLPYSDGDTSYYYYAIEKTVPENYAVSYYKTTTTAGQTTQITNSLPTQMTIQKEWYADGTKINAEDAAASALPDTISVSVYQKLRTESAGNASQALTKPADLKIIALGDSITNGSYGSHVPNESDRYYAVLQQMLRSDGYTSAVVQNCGVDGNETAHMTARLDQIDFTGVTKMTLLSGTNDVLHGDSAGGLSGAPDRMETLIRAVFTKASDAGISDFELYVGTIPYITLLGWFQYPNENPTQAQANALVDAFNQALTEKVNELITEGFDITLVDVNAAVDVIDANGDALPSGEIMLADGCHPNAAGYAKIAEAYYNAINAKYLGGSVTTVTNPTNIAMPGTDADIVSQFSGTLYGTYILEKSRGYQLTLQDLPEQNALGVAYVYYIKEDGTHVLSGDGTYYTLSGAGNRYISAVTYANNGLPAADSGTVTIRNTIETAELSIRKVWNDETDHSGDTVTIRVHRETTADSEDAQQNVLTLKMSAENGSTIQIPLGNTDGVEITSNKSVNPTVSGTGIATPSTETATKKVWIIRPADDAQVGDTAAVTFTDESGQQVTVNIEIVDNPSLVLTLSNPTVRLLDSTEPAVSSVTFKPSGGAAAAISDFASNPDVTFQSTNDSVVSVDSQTGAMTVNGVGTAGITVSYASGGVTYTSDPVTVTVSLPEHINAGDVTFAANGSAQIPIGNNYGTFTYSVNAGFTDRLTVDAGGNVSGSEAGTYENAVRVTRNDGVYEDVNVTVTAGAITGTLDNGITYSYDPAAHIITISIPKGSGTNNQHFKFNSIREDDNLKDLIPTKYVLTPTGTSTIAVYGVGNGWYYEDNKSSTNPLICDVSGNTTKISDYYGDFGVWDNNDAGPYTLQIYVKSSDSGGGSGTDNEVVVNQQFGNGYEIGEIEQGSQIEVKISGEAYKGYKISLSGNVTTSPEWTHNNSAGYAGTLDGNGEATVTITAAYTFTYTQLQSWWYDSHESNELTLVSYTVTPPPSLNVNSANASSRSLTRFSSRLLTKSAALSFTSQLTGTSGGGEEPQAAAAADFNDSGYMDITLTAAGSWQKALSGLPVYKVNSDGTLQNYYYWAEEIEINGKAVAGYTVSCSFTDGDSTTEYSINAANPGSEPLITIRNTPTETPPAVPLPESGGTGTKICYMIGGLLLMLSAAGYASVRRRRWLNE